MATRAMSSGARTLPKPTYTGGVPASRNASSSAGSGRSSGRIHAPVCTTSRSGEPGHGHRIGSAASHGRSVKTWSRTLSTGGRPIAARWALSGVAVQRVHPFGVHVPQHPVVGHARRKRPARPRQRRMVRRRQDAAAVEGDAARSGCPVSRRPTARRPASGRSPPARRIPRPPRRRCRTARRPARPRAGARPPASAASRRAPARAPTGPTGTSGTPTRASQLREVRRRAHPHLRAECPQRHRESHQRFDVPARPPRRQQHTHFATPNFRRVLASASDSAA